MNAANYLQTQATLLLACGILADLPLEEFLGAIVRAEGVGWVLDPTLYRARAKKMEQIKELAQGALGIQRVVLDLRESAAGPGSAELPL